MTVVRCFIIESLDVGDWWEARRGFTELSRNWRYEPMAHRAEAELGVDTGAILNGFADASH